MVIDTSAVMAVLLHEPERDRLIRATVGVVLLSPASLPWEVGNALVACVRRRRVSPIDLERAWDAFAAITLRVADVNIGRAMALAIEHDLYAYDGYMLALAVDRRVPLLTLDTRLAMAARRQGVAVVEI